MAQTVYGETDRTRGLLDYSTSQTNTDFTLTVRSRLQAKSYGYSGYRVNTKLAGTTVSTKLGYVPGIYTSWTDAIDTGNYSKTYTRTHAAQSVVIKSEYYGEGTGDYYAGSKSGDTSVTVTIPAKASYTVSYNANGGSGAPGSQTKWYGETLTLSSTVPTRTNYVFLGWSTSNTATSATYSSGGSYTSNAAATLYAVWKLNAYTVSYNKGSNGTGTNTTDTKIHGTDLTLKGAIFTRTGYTQTGWSTTDGGAKTYNLSASYTTNAAVTLYPFWTINTWTVSYNLQGGSGTFANQTKTYNVTLTLRSGSPTKASASAGSYTVSYNANGGTVGTASASAARTTAYTFTKWNTAANGSGTNYNSGGSYTANAGATLYAQYSASTSTAAVTLPTPTRTGYTFAGWYTSQSGGNPIAGTSYTPSGTVTLYAHWTPVTYTISYSASGASNVPSSQSQTRDQYMTVTSQKPTKTDYVFNGWDTSSSATTVRVTPGQKYMPNANTILYGVFTLNYSDPKITSVSVVRCNSGGTAQDDGTYAKVSFNFQTFSSNYKATRIDIDYKLTSASTWTSGYVNTNPNAYSGTVSQVIGGSLGADNTYDVRIKVTDSVDNATYTTFMSSAFFAIDQNAAGTALGFGMSAYDSSVPSNGRADFGMDVHFNNQMYLGNDDLSILTPRYSESSQQLSSSGWYRVCKIVFTSASQSNGSGGILLDVILASSYNNTNNNIHKVSLLASYLYFSFVNETSRNYSTDTITKVRYTTDGNGNGYIDLYYAVNVGNVVNATVSFNSIKGISGYESMGFASVASAPSGETVRAEYTFNANVASVNQNGTATPESGVTLGETRVVRRGNTVEVKFYATCATAPAIDTATRLATISGVTLPNSNVRWLAGQGVTAYQAYYGAYAILDTNGVITVRGSASARPVFNIDVTYTVDS